MRVDELIAEAGLRQSGLLVEVAGDPSVDVRGVTMDSRSVTPGALFACVPGHSSDGHIFAAGAISDGASALLCEQRLPLDVTQVVVTSVRLAIGPVCDALFGHPSRDLTVVGVTGTNGKTTTCAFLRAIFDANGWPATTIGTLTQQRTTPEAPELQALLAEWRDTGGRAVAMEVSSHALAQHRTDAVFFAAGLFTNLSPEHLDYHHTMDAYFEAKSLLFEPGRIGLAVVHGSDPWGEKLADRLRSYGTRVETFDSDDVADLVLEAGGSRFTWMGRNVTLNVGGRFNVLNALGAAACARALGIDPDTVASGLSSVTGISGRFELVDEGQSFTVIVDYAHTPDGLSQTLSAARELSATGRLIVVFGAGGDRDHEKRPLMGAAASRLADLAVVTSDNPRSEDPATIIDQILNGAPSRSNLTVEPDRASAISAALANAGPGDVVVIAGKGHERGQEIAGRTFPFDDVEVAKLALHRILESRRGTA